MEENSSENNQQNAAGDPKSVTPVPAISIPVQPPKPVVPTQQTGSQPTANSGASEEEETIKKTEKEMGKFERWILRATWAGVLAAAITGYFIYNQFKAMTDQNQILGTQTISAVAGAIESERNTREQLRIAQKQAVAAQNSVKAIQRQMRQDQRAWIDVQFGEFSLNQAGQMIVLITIKNIGKTPAKRIRLFAVLEVLKNTEAAHLYKKDMPSVTDHEGILTPLSDSKIPASTLNIDPADKRKAVARIMSEAEINDFKKGKLYFVVHGKVTYWDVFKVEHWRSFCNYALPPVGQVEAGSCVEYNKVDDK
jgi:hypothetical protein